MLLHCPVSCVALGKKVFVLDYKVTVLQSECAECSIK